MKPDWRNLVIAGLAGALLWSLWEQARLYFIPPPIGAVSMFPESRFLESVEVFGDGATMVAPVPQGPPAEFYDAAVRAEGIPGDTRTGSLVTLLDLMGCNTPWDYWFDDEIYQECYARSGGTYLTMGIQYQWIRHLDRTFVTAHDNYGDQLAAGEALRIMQRDFEAAYSASERESFEQRWKEQHPELAGFLDDAERLVAE
ncbi:MAG: hypothetical protein OXI73_07455 [Rhodospirillales bacterium]|nr:hypothetical protein [Rhodospirillales bacterium]